MKRKQSAETGEETDSSDDYKSEGPKLPKSPFLCTKRRRRHHKRDMKNKVLHPGMIFVLPLGINWIQSVRKKLNIFFLFFKSFASFFPFAQFVI